MSPREGMRRDQDDGTEDWVKVLERLPFIGSIKRDLSALRRLLYDRRPPRIAAVGTAESGRTSIANALLSALTFGERGAMPNPEAGRWVSIDADGRRLYWIEITAERETSAVLELARRPFDERAPDVLLGVLDATAIDRDAPFLRDALVALRAHVDRASGRKPAIVIALAKADALAPSGTLPSESTEKALAAERAVKAARDVLGGVLGIAEDAIVALSARPLDEGARWNVDRLADELVEQAPEAAKLESVRAFEVGRDARRRVARALVNSASALAVTIGLAPIPFADAFVLLPLQAAMVTGVAYLSGRPWDRRAATEWIASVGISGGAGFGLRWGAQQLVKLVPGAGTLIGASVAGAGTLAIGRSAIAYFVDGPGRATKRAELRAENPAA